MRFLLPTGIGDSVWALMKIPAIAKARNALRIDIGLTCGEANKLESRALDFVSRFKFIDSVKMCPLYGILHEPVFTSKGYWNYVEDGVYTFKGETWCVLTPNAALERGIRLEDWLPHYAINWDIFSDFRILPEERDLTSRLHHSIGPYAVFYPGPLDGNTVQGHNRNMIWRPQDWLELGRRIHSELGLNIVVVGAPYDASYYDTLLAPIQNGEQSYWTNLIGKTNIGELFSVTDGAEFVISYQAGVGIVSTYLKTPTGIFWRAKGDSLLREGYLSFEESMASAWVPPAMLANGAHMPLIYGRHGVDYIMSEIKSREWA